MNTQYLAAIRKLLVKKTTRILRALSMGTPSADSKLRSTLALGYFHPKCSHARLLPPEVCSAGATLHPGQTARSEAACRIRKVSSFM